MIRGLELVSLSDFGLTHPATISSSILLWLANDDGAERRRDFADGRARRGEARRAMGKRKSSKPPPKKVAPKVDTTFTCPFCNHDKSVFARLDHVAEKGMVECGTCGQKYTCNITHLSEPIDVYSDWIDACERVNAKEDEDEDE